MIKELIITFILIFPSNNGFPVVIEDFNTKKECHYFALELMSHSHFYNGNFSCIGKVPLKAIPLEVIPQKKDKHD